MAPTGRGRLAALPAFFLEDDEMRKIVVLDVMPDGRVVPVMPDDLPDFTMPPEGLSRPVRKRWQRRYDDFRAQYAIKADEAWYRATRAVLGKAL